MSDESLEISFDAPNTSPEIPPKFLFEEYCISIAIIVDVHNDTTPVRPVAKQIKGRVIPVAATNLRLSFIALVNGELRPSQADCPR